MQQTADPGDDPRDITWMSCAELGRSRGISTASAKRLSNRRRWRKQAGNDGTTRVAVPVVEAVSREAVSGDVPGDVPLHARALAALEDALTAANIRAEAALALADRTLAQLADAHARADRAETRAARAEAAIAGERQRTDLLRDRIDAMQAQIAAAEAAAEQGRAEAQAAQDAAEALRRAPTLPGRRGGAWRGSGRRGRRSDAPALLSGW